MVLILGANILVLRVLAVCIDICGVGVMDNPVELRLQIESLSVSLGTFSLQRHYLILSSLVDGSLPLDVRSNLVVPQLKQVNLLLESLDLCPHLSILRSLFVYSGAHLALALRL